MSDWHGTSPSPIPPGSPAAARAAARGQLFDGYLEGTAPAARPADSISSLPIRPDGPAVFIMLIAGFVVLGLALYVEIAYEAADLAASGDVAAAGGDRLPRACCAP